MAFSAGVFSRLYTWVTDRDASVPITASRMDAEMDGMATALSACVLKDGTQTITANIPMSGFLFTGTGAATARTHLARADQVQDASLIYAAASGTDTYTCTLVPAVTALVNGQMIAVKFTNANTGAATLNPNSIGAIDIKKHNDQALVSGDIEANSVKLLQYNSTGPKFALVSPADNFPLPVAAGGTGATSLAAATILTGALGSTDNAVLRADGTGGVTAQGSAATLDDTGVLAITSTATAVTLTRSNDGASGVTITGVHNSASPAANDIPLVILSQAKDSGGNTENYARMQSRVVVETHASEQGQWEWYTNTNGSEVSRLIMRVGLYTPNATSGDMGADTINASNYYISGRIVKPFGCWGYVTVSGGTPTLADSDNVTSITDTATGQLTVTIATDHANANYGILPGLGQATGGKTFIYEINASKAVGSFLLETSTTAALADPVAWHFGTVGDF